MAIRSTQEDYLLSQIRKIAAMIARAMGLRASGDIPAARAEIDNAWSSLLGPESALFRMLDPVSASNLISDPRKIAAVAQLTSAEAALAADAGDQQSERALAERVRVFAGEAVKRDPENEDVISAVEDLRR